MADPEAPTKYSTGATILERRYRLLLRSYPQQYRAERGQEILSTLLDATPPGQRSPSLADAVDILGNGLRRRWGLVGIAGLDAGVALAAPVALALAAGISGFAWWRVEPAGAGVHLGETFGPFRTLGPIAYAAWIAAALGWVLLRPVARRVLIGIAVGVTLALPLVAPLTTVDRPPLWVLMALSVFGLLALAGSGSTQPSLDARLVVPVGAAGIAVAASTVSMVASPDGSAGYYYQPTIARVGTVVTATVAILAAIAVVRQVRRQGSAAWLWAAALLGLPAGWLGPFEAGGMGPGAGNIPHFGRLAQVVLATCVAAGTLAWLARRAVPTSAALRTVGAAALGSALGLGAFLALGMAGLGSAGTASRTVPWYVFAPIGALLTAGAAATAGGTGDRRRAAAVGGVATGAALAAAWLVGVYDNAWTAAGWADFGRTASLAITVALLPLSACAHVAARILVGRVDGPAARWASVAALVVSLGWIGYAALPHLLAWAPMLVTIALCWVAAVLPRRTCA
jgi:hypothetical protein